MCPLLSWTSAFRSKQRILVAVLTCLDLLATAWMVLQYTVQVPNALVTHRALKRAALLCSLSAEIGRSVIDCPFLFGLCTGLGNVVLIVHMSMHVLPRQHDHTTDADL